MHFPIHMHVNNITECCPTFRFCKFIVIDKFVEAKAIRNNYIT